MAEDVLIDYRQLDLICVECAEGVAEIFGDFVSEFPQFLSSLNALTAAGNADGVAKIFHQLKGSSSTFGMARFADLLKTFELDAMEGKLPSSGQLVLTGTIFDESVRQIRARHAELTA